MCERLLDEYTDSALDERQRDVDMRYRRHSDGDRVDPFEQIASVGKRNGSMPRGDVPGTAAINIDDADQLDAFESAKYPRVVLAQMAHANHGHTNGSGHAVLSRPMIVMLASFAEAITACPSRINVLPASIESADAPATRIAWTVARPMTGTSNRISCLGFATLMMRTPGPAR